MNLVDFFTQHQRAGTIRCINQGFQKSRFAPSCPDVASIMKMILNQLLVDADRSKVYNQLQSGGLPSNIAAQSKTDTCKKQSFCTEFTMMVSNLVGLVGFELSKYLMAIFGMKHFIKLVLDEINTATTYEDIGTYVNYIRNMYALGTNNVTMSTPFTLDDDFDIEKYSNLLTNTMPSKNGVNYFEMNVNVPTTEAIFNWMLKYIDTNIRNDNVISFNEDRSMFYNVIADMLAHTKLGKYDVTDINELLINLGKFNVCYDKSLIKMFELLYLEGLCDIPAELRRGYKPYVVYIENDLKLDVKCDKCQANLNKYFHEVVEHTFKCVNDTLHDDTLTVNIHDDVYEMLVDVTLNMFVTMCRKIYNNQLVYGFFGKSTRIQFIQVFQALMDSIPRFYTLTKSQRTVIHYVLLSDKIINDSIEAVNRMNGVVAVPTHDIQGNETEVQTKTPQRSARRRTKDSAQYNDYSSEHKTDSSERSNDSEHANKEDSDKPKEEPKEEPKAEPRIALTRRTATRAPLGNRTVTRRPREAVISKSDV